MLGQMERMMVALGHQPQPSTDADAQQPQQARANMQLSNTSSSVSSISVPGTARQQSWDPIPLMQQQQQQQQSMAGLGGSQQTQKATSGSSQRTPSMSSEVSGGSSGGQPTLPPHPKQKNLGALPEDVTNNTSNVPDNNRFPSIGIGRGLSLGMSRGLSTESTSSAVIMKNSWEDKFFHSLMLGDNEGAAAAQQQMAANNAGGSVGESMASGPVSDEAMQAAIAAAQRAQIQGGTVPNAVRQSTAAVLLEAANLSPDDV